MPGIAGATGQFGSFPAGVRGPGADFSSGKNAVAGFVPHVSGPVDDDGPVIRDEGAYEHRSNDNKPFTPGLGDQLDTSMLPIDVTRARGAPKLKAGGPGGPNDPGNNPFGSITWSAGGISGVYGRGAGELRPGLVSIHENPFGPFGEGFNPRDPAGPVADDAGPPDKPTGPTQPAPTTPTLPTTPIGPSQTQAPAPTTPAQPVDEARLVDQLTGAILGAVLTGAGFAAAAGRFVPALVGPAAVVGAAAGGYGGWKAGGAAHDFMHHRHGAGGERAGDDSGGARDVLPSDDGPSVVIGPRSRGYLPSDESGSPIGPRAYAYLPSDESGSPIGPHARDWMPSDEGGSPINPRAHILRAANVRSSNVAANRFFPAPDDASGPVGPRV